MNTATFTHPSSRPSTRWVVPGLSLALGVAAMALSVVAITTDDVAGSAGSTRPAIEAPEGRTAAITTAWDESCAFLRPGSSDHC